MPVPFRISHRPQLACLLLLAAAIVLAAHGRLELHGDGNEYLIQTQSIVFDRQLKIDTARRAAYWNSTSPLSLTLGSARPPGRELSESSQAGGGFGALFPDRFGSYRYSHFWLYSALVAPLYFLLHVVGQPPLEYQAFKVMNILFLVLPLLAAFRQRPRLPLVAAFGLALISPLIPYTDWPHPELFMWSSILLSFQLLESRRFAVCSPLLLGLAAAQNLPALLFFPAHLLYAARHADRFPRKPLARAAAYAAGALAGTMSILYNYYYFGVPAVATAINAAGFEHASVLRTFSLIASPMIGTVWFFPAACFLLLPSLNRRNAFFIGVLLTCVAAAAWLASATTNLNSDRVGCMRYGVWLSAPLLFAALRWLPESLCGAHPPRWRIAAGAVATLVTIFYFHLLELPFKYVNRFVQNRTQPEVARFYKYLHWPDDVEVLVENIRTHELAGPHEFRGIYIWNLGGPNSLWIVSRRALRDMRSFWWTTEGMPEYTAAPAANRVLRKKGIAVSFDRREPLTFRRHPVFGDYLLLWVKRAVAPRSISSSVPVFVASSEEAG